MGRGWNEEAIEGYLSSLAPFEAYWRVSPEALAAVERATSDPSPNTWAATSDTLLRISAEIDAVRRRLAALTPPPEAAHLAALVEKGLRLESSAYYLLANYYAGRGDLFREDGLDDLETAEGYLHTVTIEIELLRKIQRARRRSRGPA